MEVSWAVHLPLLLLRAPRPVCTHTFTLKGFPRAAISKMEPDRMDLHRPATNCQVPATEPASSPTYLRDPSRHAVTLYLMPPPRAGSVTWGRGREGGPAGSGQHWAVSVSSLGKLGHLSW